MTPSIQETTSTQKEIIWILGGGKFGRRATKLLRQVTPDATILMIEKRPALHLPSDIEFICGDGVEWLYDHFVPDSPVTKIIPAIPVHLAADWLKVKLSEEGFVLRSLEIPGKLLQQMPHPIQLQPGKVVTSHADFICPENCAEPDTLCSYTRQPRPPSLYRLLETMKCGSFIPLIIRSRQFAPGVGGFFPGDLWTLLKRARSLPDTPLLVGTACKCHGVVDAFCFHQK